MLTTCPGLHLTAGWLVSCGIDFFCQKAKLCVCLGLPFQTSSSIHQMVSLCTFSKINILLFFSGFHHHECVAPLVANSLQSGRFWARSTASVHDSPWESRSFCTVFIQVIRDRPGGLFQYTEGKEVKICFASTLSSIRAICPNRVRRRA